MSFNCASSISLDDFDKNSKDNPRINSFLLDPSKSFNIVVPNANTNGSSRWPSNVVICLSTVIFAFFLAFHLVFLIINDLMCFY